MEWSYPTERIENVTAQRRAEQQVMDDYIDSPTCLMALLGRALDDPSAAACGRCSRCTGTSLPVDLDQALVIEAQEYLRSQPLTIDPRKMQAVGGRIAADRQLEPGRSLSFLGDGGWGRLVREQRAAGHFTDELVDAAVRLIRQWGPEPRPTWVTSVPSVRHPDLVRSLAERIAAGLDLAHIPAVVTTRTAAPQAEMENSVQQHRNVMDAFTTVDPVPRGAVLLVDDIADSRWTLTEIGGILRDAGVAAVVPVTLALGSSD
jgi:ATP-dependent DNA helicase RecQ